MEKFTWANVSTEEAKNNKGKNFFIDGFFVKNQCVKLVKKIVKKEIPDTKKHFVCGLDIKPNGFYLWRKLK